MYYDELRRYTAGLCSAVTAKDNSLADVKVALEALPNPPKVVLEERTKGNSTQCHIRVYVGNDCFHMRCVISELAFAVMRSSVSVAGERKEWCWNSKPDDFKFEGTDVERQTVHSFIAAIINAL
ncbi:hypothetical protein PHOBOS_99 [Erwinia phage vB_EamM_Phobos]|uniref:hypothetical protein n=1 Tax=Erwinia phage vB_EamM_Phobos TaxID=1883377 RepID=UPI00081D31E3|nr:hypothetical protein BIZ79_gp099 [Erwinia phage vB_EamM_Phobos]ANZ50289.1 hypothetical protein PHOBOS_99 [Erwinia phage vB_EamM_Phobos]